VAGTNAHGRIAQPKGGKSYNISAPLPQEEPEYGQISSNQVPAKFARISGLEEANAAPEPKGHKRSNTIGGFFSRSGSVFGGKKNTESTQEKPKKSYPPVSMSGAVAAGGDTPRQSMDSRRSISFGFGKKRSGSITGSQTTTLHEKPRRFSLLPTSFSLKSIGIGKDAYGTGVLAPSDQQYESHPDSRGNYTPPNPEYSQLQTRNVSTSNAPYSSDGAYDRNRDSPLQDRRGTSTASPPQHQRYASQPIADPRSGAPPQFLPPLNFRQDQSALTTESESSLNDMTNRRGAYPPGFNDYDDRRPVGRTGSSGRGVLTKNNRKFTEAYEQDQGNGWGPTHTDHAGSSGAARKVMDFFRRRGKDRGGER
jgi:protein-serine/threonine kinase